MKDRHRSLGTNLQEKLKLEIEKLVVWFYDITV